MSLDPKPDPIFEDIFPPRERFPFLDRLEAAYDDVYGELRQLQLEDFAQWPELSATDPVGQWFMFGLVEQTFPGMDYLWDAEANRARCPKTTALVESINGVTDAGFSLLLPRTHLLPHRGFEPHLFRAHLCLHIPEGGVQLNCGAQQRTYRNGEAYVFDDLYLHDATNDADDLRVVLLICFERAAYGF